jgi:hypothetical protein
MSRILFLGLKIVTQFVIANHSFVFNNLPGESNFDSLVYKTLTHDSVRDH